ncbi:MAG: hypothetical protein AB1465_07425 [Patescibacteria group bacterium]
MDRREYQEYRERKKFYSLPRNKTELIAKLPEIFYILGLIFVIIGGYCAMIVPYDTFRNLVLPIKFG